MIENPLNSLLLLCLAVSTVFFQVVVTLLITLYLFIRFSKHTKRSVTRVADFLSEHALAITFLISTTATVGSLFLSEIAHLTPCELCWFQRIFMYPQALLLGLAYWWGDHKILRYTLPLSIIGFGIAAYHFLVQLYPTIIPCTDEVANCALKQIQYFGYITIPVMSATAFLLLIVVTLFGNLKRK